MGPQFALQPPGLLELGAKGVEVDFPLPRRVCHATKWLEGMIEHDRRYRAPSSF